MNWPGRWLVGFFAKRDFLSFWTFIQDIPFPGTKVVTHFSTPPAVCHVVLFVVPKSTQKVHLRLSLGSEKWIFSISVDFLQG